MKSLQRLNSCKIASMQHRRAIAMSYVFRQTNIPLVI